MKRLVIAFAVVLAMSFSAFGETDTRLMRVLRKPDKTIQEIEKVIADGADVNAADNDGYIPIIYAATSPIITRIIAEAGADIDVQGTHWSQRGRTALMEAAVYFSDVDTIKLLISKKNINMTDNDGMTALVEAAIHNKPQVVKAMIDAGSDVRQYGGSALMGAASWNCNPETARLLIAAGADVNAKAPTGRTPLMLAASSYLRGESPEDIADFIRVLIEAGADVSLKDENGKTALDFAKNDNVRKILREAMK